MDNSGYKGDQIIKQNDLAFVDLYDIEIIYISPQKDDKMYQVNFFKLWDKFVEESVLHVFLEENDFQKLMETLRDIFQITKEERNIIKYGDFALYSKMKKEI